MKFQVLIIPCTCRLFFPVSRFEFVIRSVNNLKLARHHIVNESAETTMLIYSKKSIKCLEMRQERKTQIDRRGHGCTSTQIVYVPTQMRSADWPVARSLMLLQDRSTANSNRDIVGQDYKKNTNSTQNKSQTHRAKQYEVTPFLSTDCELSTETCSKNVYSLGPGVTN